MPRSASAHESQTKRRGRIFFGVCDHSGVTGVQIFGVKNSQATRAAERFFKERRVPIQFVDLAQRPMSPGELRRFSDRFGLAELLDRDGKSFESSGLKYLRVSDDELLNRVEKDPRLLRLPLVRSANLLSAGHDESAWKAMTANHSTLK